MQKQEQENTEITRILAHELDDYFVNVKKYKNIELTAINNKIVIWALTSKVNISLLTIQVFCSTTNALYCPVSKAYYNLTPQRINIFNGGEEHIGYLVYLMAGFHPNSWEKCIEKVKKLLDEGEKRNPELFEKIQEKKKKEKPTVDPELLKSIKVDINFDF